MQGRGGGVFGFARVSGFSFWVVLWSKGGKHFQGSADARKGSVRLLVFTYCFSLWVYTSFGQKEGRDGFSLFVCVFL